MTENTGEKTEKVWIKSYTLTELAKMEWVVHQTIKNRSSEYIPVKFENTQARTKYKRWEQKTPYSIRYIRRKDFEKYMKENWFEYFLLK